ncbi:hypothetical protein A3A79_01715 [Candidatus Gottesmanbacteria bacterium RIFCSPLOWO2_01_FULL_43_11b]|uniref:Membrane protein 6-pyruvoyl-tetrahydropterin synthase-related domain-containing protein n=1 Tax=Candidatus Gottesmanbacteria bacterium RIFCSPLOWO2_01_FULL_43_11b TaxID=1798392 RepID=A0A1F6AHZ9_9BACT|nr:MAG: hypothetical protein A3A79_01715 [Candidatus Gottesmanbacteria bacterium RIFCSPLOWO2_01_FULL_43_11b]
MPSLRTKLRTYWPILLLAFVELILFSTNYKPGTWLIGWDNAIPEFNFSEAFKRSIFGVWQEHRGVGLYDGMSHIANLVHTTFLWLLSFVLPANVLRYFFHFLMHFLGGLGVYFLLINRSKFLALTGALFYMLNFATIQMFYTPLEAFSIHFAALPWLAFAAQKKLPFWLFIVVLLTSSQFYVPTLLIPTGILLVIVARKRILPILTGFILLNAFWLLPYLWGLADNAPIIRAAKINQMSTDEVFLRNQAFGDLKNVFLLRGFSLDFEDINAAGSFDYLMASWRNFLSLPIAQLLGFALLTIALVGFSWPYGLLFMIGIFTLGNDIPIIREVNLWVRTIFPTFGEAFRFPFTKFSLLFAFSYSMLLVAGLQKLKNSFLTFAACVAIIALSWPAFTGNFLSQNLRVAIPSDYFALFEFMKTQDSSSRIAYLPQPSYWSWKYYNFGYRGSGFVWHGLRQPVMDRAFDPWSNFNENYYWELTKVLYSKDNAALSSVFAKYDIRFILLDEYLVSFSHDRALFTDETKELLSQMPNVREAAKFGKLTLYERNEKESIDYVTVKDIPTVSPIYAWTDNDVAYQELGDYIAAPTGGFTYQYRSLFTKRSVDERAFSLDTTGLVYESALDATKVIKCGLLKDGTAQGNAVDSGIRFTSLNQRGCLSFGIPILSHREGYLVEVESNHISGRPLLISFINQTAKHVELEAYLSPGVNNFILPPLASDGLGYTVYLANDSIGRYESINDIKRISFYKIPYQELVTTSDVESSLTSDVNKKTLIFNQSFHPGWVAVANSKILPHVLVNNWANGWILPSNQITNKDVTIFFWPQLLEWLGFLLLPIAFLLL